MRIVKPTNFKMGIGEWVFTMCALYLFLATLWCVACSIDCCKYISDINKERLYHYSGIPCMEDVYSQASRPKSSANTWITLELENGDWIETEYDVLRNNGITQTAVLSEKSWDIYYTQYSSSNARLNNDTKYHQLVSIAPNGYNAAMAAYVRRDIAANIMIVILISPILLLAIIFCSTPLALELRKCIETKKEQEKREKKEKRAAERRAKYLEERERLRAEKQKKKH